MERLFAGWSTVQKELVGTIVADRDTKAQKFFASELPHAQRYELSSVSLRHTVLTGWMTLAMWRRVSHAQFKKSSKDGSGTARYHDVASFGSLA